jgi:hypothetical protein
MSIYRKWLSRFRAAEDGNMMVAFALLCVPLLIAVGLATDYSSGTNTRSSMQNALDAASFAAINLPKTSALGLRTKTLQDVYAANGGLGTARIVGDVTIVDGIASLKAEAKYDMPTTFMRLANRDKVVIATTSTVSKHDKLTSAKFKLVAVTGWWDKNVTLFGRKEGETTYKPLVSMVYTYNGLGGVGVGTTTMNKISGSTTTPVFRISCAGVLVLSACTSTKLVGDGTAEADLESMDDAYLQMVVSASKSDAISLLNQINPPRTIRSNDPNLANRLFVEGERQPNGSAVNIQRAVGCGDWAEQRWEDGGNSGSSVTWANADFRYEVSGKCDWGKDKSPTLTQ